MATVEEQILLAKHIADALPEVSRNEWMRWIEVATKHGLDRAIQYAMRLSEDTTVRPAIRRANRLIAQAIQERRMALRRLRVEEQQTVFGYVSWWLRIQTLKGSLGPGHEE